MKQSYLVLGVILLLVVLAATATFLIIKNNADEFQNEAKTDLLGSGESSATYIDLLGNQINLEDFVGNVLVINSWASWSPQSQVELLSLQKLATEFSGKPVVFLAINRKESKEQATRFINTLPEVLNVKILIDTTDHFYSTIGGYAMPETVVYKSDGTKAVHTRGTFKEDELRLLISENLAEI